MKFENVHTKKQTDEYENGYAVGYIILSGRELQRLNLKFLVHYDMQRVNFCDSDFYVRKIVKYDQIFIYLFIIDSAWSKNDLERQFHCRAPNDRMNDEGFFWAHKSYKKELDNIRRKSYHVGAAPEDFLDPDMEKEVEKLKAKIAFEEKWLKNWRFKVNLKTLQFRASNKTIEKHEKKLHALQLQVNRINRIYNKPDESDPWSDCETTYEDFELYHF